MSVRSPTYYFSESRMTRIAQIDADGFLMSCPRFQWMDVYLMKRDVRCEDSEIRVIWGMPRGIRTVDLVILTSMSDFARSLRRTREHIVP